MNQPGSSTRWFWTVPPYPMRLCPEEWPLRRRTKEFAREKAGQRCAWALLNKIPGDQGTVQEATNILTYSRFQGKKNNPNLFPSKRLSANLLLEVTWNSPCPELPVPKATSDARVRITANFHSLPRGFPQRLWRNRAGTFCQNSCH